LFFSKSKETFTNKRAPIHSLDDVSSKIVIDNIPSFKCGARSPALIIKMGFHQMDPKKVEQYDAEKAFKQCVQPRPLNEAEQQMYNDVIDVIHQNATDGKTHCDIMFSIPSLVKVLLTRKGFCVRDTHAYLNTSAKHTISWQKRENFAENYFHTRVARLEAKMDEVYNSPGIPGYITAKKSFSYIRF
jgi:hypothetical protein